MSILSSSLPESIAVSASRAPKAAATDRAYKAATLAAALLLVLSAAVL